MDIKSDKTNKGGAVYNKGSGECFDDIPIKDETENETQHQPCVHPLSAVSMEQTIKFESYGDSEKVLLGNLVKSELVEFHNDEISSNYCNPSNSKIAVKLEKIPKTETQFTSSDDNQSDSSNGEDEIYNKDSNSSSDPECDPFADVDCDSGFSQKSQTHSSTDYSATQDELINSGDIVNQLLSEKSFLRRKPTISSPSDTLNSKLQCQLCLETQSSKSQLQTHVEICASSHKDRHRFCVICNKLFSCRHGFRRHALSRHGIQVAILNRLQFKCQFCACAFPLKVSLKAHLNSCRETNVTKGHDSHDSKLKPFKCQDCPSTFANLAGLKQHKVSHKNERPFKCTLPNCDKAFKFNSTLKQHLRGFHSEDRPIKCQELNCGKTFKLKEQLHKHMVCHSNDRPYKCSYANCDQAFPNQERLSKQLAAHRGARRIKPNAEKPFKCGQCDFAFCTNWELTRHSKTHEISNQTLFKCPEPNCASTFTQKGSLNVHISKIHVNKDALPFICPELNCGKAFKYKESVKYHLFTHTGVRPFKCTEPQCSAAFTRNTYLNAHVKSKHRKSISMRNMTN